MSAPEQAFSVLIVDDSPVARKLVEHALPSERYTIFNAKTGQEALDLFAKLRPGLVITDWLMPDLSGIELCQRLRADFQDCFTYIILLTGVSEKSKVVKGLQAGADEYLTKPFHPEELLARAEVGQRIVGLHRELEEKNRLLEQLALTDEVTGLPNRRAIEHWGARQLSGAIRHDFQLSVVEADLDQFKAINDTYGHDAGDAVRAVLGLEFGRRLHGVSGALHHHLFRSRRLCRRHNAGARPADLRSMGRRGLRGRHRRIAAWPAATSPEGTLFRRRHDSERGGVS